MTHTPGPWILEEFDVLGGHRASCHVATVNVLGLDFESLAVVSANAHLIAAAPDLLEALKHCIEWLDRTGESMSGDGKEYDYVTMARKAINKTEGKG